MKTRTIARSILLTIAAVITLSSLSGCVVVPARGYVAAPVTYHAYYVR
ncbi:hypothetical protein [Sapientia aquatica]|nr:hypothetical protein [Sapientia aquatica]